MIQFNYEVEFSLEHAEQVKSWISKCIQEESFEEGDINYIFSNDSYLLDMNVKYLEHNELTDIISFDYTLNKLISGDIFVSIERIKENATLFNVSFKDELHRVMIHGILHYCKFNDKTKEEKQLMRKKEDYCLSLRDF